MRAFLLAASLLGAWVVAAPVLLGGITWLLIHDAPDNPGSIGAAFVLGYGSAFIAVGVALLGALGVVVTALMSRAAIGRVVLTIALLSAPLAVVAEAGIAVALLKWSNLWW